MRVEALAVELRARQGWEAVDLGFRMAAYWAKPLWAVWLAVYLPLALAVLLALSSEPLIAAIVIWWLKPVSDRFVLFVLSRRVFGDPASLVQTLAAWRSVLSPGLLRALLLRPLGWGRNVLQAVPVLERQLGAAARSRTTLLNRPLGGHTVMLAFTCLCFELVVMMSLAALGALLMPAVEVGGAGASVELTEAFGAEWWRLGTTLAYVVAVGMIEPFYVAAGFAMYLVRRTQLEGWDIELSLRRAAVHAASRSASPADRVLRSLVVAIAMSSLVSPSVRALEVEQGSLSTAESAITSDRASVDEGTETNGNAVSKARLRRHDVQTDAAEPSPPLDTAARRAAVQVLAHRDFGRDVERMRWRLGGDEKDQTSSSADLDWLRTIGDWIAAGFRVVMWLLLAVLGIAIIWLMARRIGGAQRPSERDLPPSRLFGLAIDPTSLPDDVVAAALAALDEGRARDAVSLLYRGALSYLVHQCAMRISEGAVEGEVLQLAKVLLSKPAAAHFERLVDAWVAIAYGHRDGNLDALRMLCQEQRRYFGSEPPVATAVQMPTLIDPAGASA